jgi:hypothetical protein
MPNNTTYIMNASEASWMDVELKGSSIYLLLVFPKTLGEEEEPSSVP